MSAAMEVRKEGIRSPEIGVIDICEPQCENKTLPLKGASTVNHGATFLYLQVFGVIKNCVYKHLA